MMGTSTVQVLLVLMALVVCRIDTSTAFTITSPLAFRMTRTLPFDATKPLSMVTDDLFVDSGETVRAGDFHIPGADDNVLDPNGKEFTVGAVVRVCVEGTKTFQIPAKGCGSYDDDKKFVPQKEEPKKEKKSLKLPVGLRGTVAKVYDEREISANYPIQVKFEPGKNTEEGYDSPVGFLMHFMAHELECV